MSEFRTAPFVTVHGPDGSGKTSVGRSVVKSLAAHGQDAVFFDDWRTETGWNNPFSDKRLREKIQERDGGLLALQIAKVAMDSVVITELTDSGVTVVKDRGILDVRADLNWRGLDPTACRGSLIREPDLAVYLQVSEEARQRRLAVKEDIHPEDFQPNIPGNRMYAMTQFVETAVSQMHPGHGVVIPTDELSVEQITEQIYTAVKDTVC